MSHSCWHRAKQHQQAWAEHLGVPVESENTIGTKMVLIPPGEYLMGSPDSDPDAEDNEKPQHKVTITKPFEMAAHEVTAGQFKAFVAGAEYKTEAERAGDERTWQNPGFEQTDEHPVVWVSWNDAVAFCDWLSKEEGKIYRLPTEAEWEYTCRAGSMTRWCFGDDPLELEKYAWYARKGGDNTNPVGSKLPNGFGMFDMSGNVWELCSGWYVDYSDLPVNTSDGPSNEGSRVLRGGAFDYAPVIVRSAYRRRSLPTSRLGTVGFRPARSYPNNTLPLPRAEPIDPNNPPKIPTQPPADSTSTEPTSTSETKTEKDEGDKTLCANMNETTAS